MSNTIFVIYLGAIPKEWYHYKDQAEQFAAKFLSTCENVRIEEVDSTEHHYSDTFRNLEIKAGLLWQVNLWLSNPEEGNDDLHEREAFASELAATDAFNAYFVPKAFDREMLQNDLWVEIDGPGLSETKQVQPGFKAKPPSSYDADRHEGAMQAGMAFGCEGYNDFMGY